MVDFWVYDVSLLVIFTIWVFWFVKSRKKQISREGIIYMYRTQVGVKAINWVGDNYKKTLHALKYPVVVVGFLLMGAMLWMLWQTISIYIFHPEITNVIKAPPIAPLIPYFPKLFGMSSFFPPFYFIYFIVALAIVAIVHEFSHGMFMRLFKIKIKSTGLVFLGPILGAFVEEQKSNFEKKKNFEQMVVLAAGVFANIVFALIFYGLYVAFFFIAFNPAGYIFSSYAIDQITPSTDHTLEMDGELIKIMTPEGNYFLDENLAAQLNISGLETLIVYSDAPAVKARMKGAIIQANDVKIKNHQDLIAFLQTKNPGDEVIFKTNTGDEIIDYSVTLGMHPKDETKAYLGIGHRDPSPRGIVQKFLATFMSFKEPSTYYESTFNEGLTFFIFHFLWWIMIINFLVGLFNMLPLGMLDGGRFFYLAILSLTKSKKGAEKAFKYMGKAIFLVFILLMLLWLFRIV